MHYILVDGVPILEPDVIQWARWFDKAGKERIVAQEYVGEDWVSTVFLGLDHNFDPGPHAPILYETMIFTDGPHADEQWRYKTLDEAKAGHGKVVADLRREYEAKR